MAKMRDDTEFIGEYDFKDHKIMHAMDAEKREKFILVAMQEFTKGYAVANTDEIVREAGISKGLLFHYFGSKRGLFLFLFKYALDSVTTEYDKVVLDRGDFMENILRVSKLVIELTLERPFLYGFLTKAHFSLSEVFPQGAPKDMSNPTAAIMQKILRNSDETLFRTDVDVHKAQNIILWTMSSYTERLLVLGDDIKNYQPKYAEIMREFEDYLDILRKAFYN